MSDLIDRQAALDVIRPLQTYKLFEGDDMILVDKAEVQTELMMLPSAELGTNLAEVGTDCISRQAAIDDIWTVSPLARLDRKWVDRWLRQLPSAQPEIIRCRECKFASGDSRICMKFDHSPIGELDFCSFAERREVNNESD